jgi:hypothetical protein
MTIFDPELVIGILEINLRNYFLTADAILQLAHDWERVAVCNRDFVNAALVNL